jgi:uncharacterized protein YecE (DUF72 family)
MSRGLPSGRQRKVLVGTSGWLYGHWHGRFFPKELPKKQHLRFYARHFSTVELNGVFYRSPTIEAVQGWFDQTPDDFVFAWKASRFLTHIKRLKDIDDYSIDLLKSRLKVLRHKLGPVLFQLPPQMKPDRERLAAFLKRLPRRHRYAFEFRDRGWYDDAILDLLRENDVSLCLSDHARAPAAPWVATASHVYVRGHGANGRYGGHYDEAKLREWAGHIRKWHREGRQVHAYFDNDEEGAAPIDADRLIRMLGPRIAERPKEAPPMEPLSPEQQALPAVILRPSWKRREARPAPPAQSPKTGRAARVSRRASASPGAS